MDKTLKLQRYVRKDYSETVQFPVEIVGRDGIVRRYTFEDAIRLYQRRITFAPIRYRDAELVTAEVYHCRCRIDQLRRSYFHRFGWGTPEGQEGPLEIFGDLAGELAAFVRRVMRADGRPEVRLSPVEGIGTARSTWYLHLIDHEAELTLCVHAFRGSEADVARERFFAEVKEIERMHRGGSPERLVAFHHTVDCGFVLTGSEESAALVDVTERQPRVIEPPTPEERVVHLIRRRELERALAEARRVISAQPYSRLGYILGAVVATRLSDEVAAEDFALVGCRYFPEDALLLYFRGIAYAARERLSEAEADFEAALESDPSLAAARWMLALLRIDEHRFGAAARVLQPDGSLLDRRGQLLVQRLRHWVRYRQVMVTAGTVSLGLGVAAMALGGWVGLVPALLGSAMAVSSSLAFRLQLERLVERDRFDDPVWVLRRLPTRGEHAEPRVS